METSDPDDGMALALLCANKNVNLMGVTVTPGTRAQVGVVKALLAKCGKHIPVGSFNPDHPKDCVSRFWTGILGEASASPDALGWEVIDQAAKTSGRLTLITGGPLKNCGQLLKNSSLPIFRWVGQGGFAGDSVVPEENRLEKFKGMETCPTFNFNGDPVSAFAMLGTDLFSQKVLVSKNVCHGVVYDMLTHERFMEMAPSGFEAFDWFVRKYLDKHGSKMFHDPLACAVAIDESVCQFREVEIYREKGKWGSKIKAGNTRISVSVDQSRMLKALSSA